MLTGGQCPLQLGSLLLGGAGAGAALAQLGQHALQPLPQLRLLLLRPHQRCTQPLHIQPAEETVKEIEIERGGERESRKERERWKKMKKGRERSRDRKGGTKGTERERDKSKRGNITDSIPIL